MKRVLIIGSTYGMSDEEIRRLNLYISTLQEVDVWGGHWLSSSHSFDYDEFHRLFFPEFSTKDEIQIFCRRNDPKNFYLLAGIICGQTGVPVKVLEEFSDPEAGLYKQLKAREEMNDDFKKVEAFASIERISAGAIIPTVILLGLSLFTIACPELLDVAWIISAPAVSFLIPLIVYTVQEESFARTKKRVKNKDS